MPAMRSADNPVLVEFREDWSWRLNRGAALIQEYIDGADKAGWSSERIPAIPSDVAFARKVLTRLLGVTTCTGSDNG